jgi:hypothetical protein
MKTGNPEVEGKLSSYIILYCPRFSSSPELPFSSTFISAPRLFQECRFHMHHIRYKSFSLEYLRNNCVRCPTIFLVHLVQPCISIYHSTCWVGPLMAFMQICFQMEWSLYDAGCPPACTYFESILSRLVCNEYVCINL